MTAFVESDEIIKTIGVEVLIARKNTVVVEILEFGKKYDQITSAAKIT